MSRTQGKLKPPTVPHAVTSLTQDGEPPVEVGSYQYDADGNMTCRVEDGSTYKQTFNAENRLSIISRMNGDCATGTVSESWLFAYDGDGTRVAQVYTNAGTSSTETTLYFMGGAYEVNNPGLEQQVTKYYSIAGQRIAMDDGSGMKYLLTDHLGSVVAVTNDSGGLLSDQRYMPFGEVRPDTGITQTDFGYTGSGHWQTLV